MQQLPEHITTADAQSLVGYYIIKQTHEPLFRQDDGQNYHSNMLKSWGRSVDSTRYTFCPDKALVFSGDKLFAENFFETYITSTTAKFISDFNVTQNNSCFDVAFKQPVTDYLSFLTDYENAPTVARTKDIEDGLGPFYVKTLGKKSITLYRKHSIRDGFNKIVFTLYSGKDDPQLNNRAIQDFNFMRDSDIPKWIQNTFLTTYNMELASILLVINHPDPRIRNILYNCIEPNALSAAFMPHERGFRNIQTVLPLGIPGALPGHPDQNCDAALRSAPREHAMISVMNRYTDNQNALDKFLKSVSNRTGLTIKVIKAQASATTPNPYNLRVLYISTVRPAYDIFFSTFITDPRFNNFDTANLKKLYEKFSATHNEAAKIQIAQDMANELRDQHVILPLYQDSGHLYYPKNVKNIILGQGFAEYIDVGDLRW